MRENGFRAVGGLAQRLASGLARGRKASVARLKADWPEIAGPALARVSEPEALMPARGRAGATMRLRVAGAAAVELQHGRAQLVERVNSYFGHRAIEDIKLVQGPIHRPAPRRAPADPDAATLASYRERTAAIADPDLRAALARLGARIATTRRGLMLAALAAAGVSAFDDARAQARATLAGPRAGDRILGRADAPIVLIEYASLTCAGCARVHTDVMPAVKRRWIDSGRARLVFRHFPFDQVATRAAQLLECGGGDQFFAALDIALGSQDGWVRTGDPVATLGGLLGRLGITPAQVAACGANVAALDKVVSDVQSGEAAGVTGTPTFFVNGVNIGNPGDVEGMDAALQKARR